MCGISGFVYFDNAPVEERIIHAMSDVQQHRGPDEHGAWLSLGKDVER